MNTRKAMWSVLVVLGFTLGMICFAGNAVYAWQGGSPAGGTVTNNDQGSKVPRNAKTKPKPTTTSANGTITDNSQGSNVPRNADTKPKRKSTRNSTSTTKKKTPKNNRADNK